jgi:hypothetical protein
VSFELLSNMKVHYCVHESPNIGSSPHADIYRIDATQLFFLGGGRASRKKERKKGKAIPVTGHGAPWGCEIPRLLHFLDYCPTDNGEVVGLIIWPPLTQHEDSWYSFMLEAESMLGSWYGYKN